MERFWQSMRSAVDPAMIETGLTEYIFDAMVMAGDVHNQSSTASNQLSADEPPFSTLGWGGTDSGPGSFKKPLRVQARIREEG